MKKGDQKNQKNQRKSPNIFKKMFFGFVIVPIIPILALVYLTYSSQQEQEKFVEANLVNSSQLIGTNIDKWIDTNLNISRLTSQFEDIVSMDPERQKPILSIMKQNSDAITAVRIDNSDGLAVARSDSKKLKNYADRIYFQQVKSGQPFGQQVIFGKTQQKPLLCFSVPVNNEEQFMGSLTQCSTLDDISTNVTNLKIGNTGYAFLVDRAKQLVAHGGNAKSLTSNELEDMTNHPALQGGVANEVFSYNDASGQRMLAYKKQVGLDWTLVVQQDYKEAFAKPIQARNSAILTILLTALACFSIIYFMSKTISRPIQEAREETDNILGAANDGLFLIDRDYTIGNQQSSNLSTILQRDNLSGTSFIRYLNDSVPVDIAQMARDYIELLFTKRVKEELVQSRNPLKMVQTSVENKNGELESKYLSLTFKRVFENDEIANLFVTAKDITKEVLLQKELDKVKEDKNDQVNLLTDILYIPASDLNVFLTETEQVLNSINATLEQPGSDPEMYRSKIDTIFQLIHKVKGDAAAINFELFANECHNFEDILNKMRGQRNNLTGNEFLPLTLALEELFKKCNMVDELLGKIGAFSTTSGSSPMSENVVKDDTPENLKQWYQLKTLANNLAEKHSKNVEVHFKGFNITLPKKYNSALKDISTQLIRNSMVHGIEESSIRRQQGKITEGQITMAIKHTHKEGFVFTYMDDGHGIDYLKVKEKIVSSGIATIDEVEEFSEEQLLKIIFQSGFSSKDEADLDAGRGVGLSLVIDKVRGLGGRIKLSSVMGKRMVFKIVLPDTPNFIA